MAAFDVHFYKNVTAMILQQRLGLEKLGANFGLLTAFFAILLFAFLTNLIFDVNFFNPSNLSSISRIYCILIIVAIGQMIAIISGGMDLCVGQLMSITGMFAAASMQGANMRLIPGLIICLAFAVAVGLANGLLIAKKKIPPFITTLGMMIVLEGGKLIYTKGVPSGKVPTALKALGTGNFLGIPLIIYPTAIIVIFFYYLMKKSTYSRDLYATGCNPEAARLTGVRTDRVIIVAYVISALCAALAGLLLLGYNGTASNSAGIEYNVNSLAAAALGGAVIGGGRGSVLGTILGGFILVTLSNLTLLINLPVETRYVVLGLSIIVAVVLYNLKSTSE
jgi:ribose/xylose/arabinose/galactoside ABC-type transport system permease subunit